MAGAAMDNPRVTKVLLDTDIGTNLDDAPSRTCWRKLRAA
jgi:hypothetical protein